MNIAFIGLGIMGSRMAANLMQAGHTVTIHNRTRAKAEALIADGAAWAESPASAVADAELVITMLAHPEAVRAVALGENGLLAAIKPGTIWVDCSTVNPSFTWEMAATAAEHDAPYLDVPVAGSKNQAANAELVFFVGGEAERVETATPVLNAMGKAVIHVGGSGMGSSLKMVVNGLLATSMAAFAESVALGRALGLSQETLFKVLIGGPVVAPFMVGKQGKMESGDYTPEFPLQWMTKDLQLASASAYETGTPSPLIDATKALFQSAVQQGHGDSDFSALFASMND